MREKRLLPAILGVALFALTACEGQGQVAQLDSIATPDGLVAAPVDRQADPRHYSTEALLFTGSGTWATEVSALKGILGAQGVSYQAATESTLNAMTLDDLARYGMIIFPGGSGGTEAGSLTSATRARIRQAVQRNGLSYIGFCAGAFIAAAPAPAAGGDVSYGIGVLDAPELAFYQSEYQGRDLDMTVYTFGDGRKRDIVYYGGPVTPNIAGAVVATYPNGDPAITQAWSGAGLVTMVGGHPTLPAGAAASLGLADSDGADQDIAWELLRSTLNRQPMAAVR